MSSAKGFAKFIIVLTTVTAAVMELIDTSIVNVGLNEMSGSLGVSIEDISWVITSYAIANVIIIPMTGFLAEYFGRKNYYVFSMIIFTAASYMCAQSTGLVELIGWRFIQGVGGGALLSTSQAILFDAFKRKIVQWHQVFLGWDWFWDLHWVPQSGVISLIILAGR